MSKKNIEGSGSRLGTRIGRRGSRAFTLIELLVVVSIIALLIAILLPSLKKAREQAKSATCLANLHAIALASLIYAADDPNEQAVPVQYTQFYSGVVDQKLHTRIGPSAWGGKSGRGEVVDNEWWWGTREGRGPARRPLNPFLYKQGFVDYKDNPGVPGSKNWKADQRLDLGTYRCPGDKGYVGGLHYGTFQDSGLTSYDHYGNSYAANVQWIYLVGSSPCYLWSNSPYLRPVSRIPNPANTLYYEENCGRFAFKADPQPEACDYEPVYDIVHGWHGRDWNFNAAFADGHAKTIRIKGVAVPPPHLASYPNCPPWCYQTWDCVIIRGEGWQIDTLPGPHVETRLPCTTASGG